MTNICSETVQKLNLIEVSDLVLKWMLLRIYGGCMNQPVGTAA